MNKPNWYDHHIHDVEQLTDVPLDDKKGFTVERISEIAFIATILLMSGFATIVALELVYRIWTALA